MSSIMRARSGLMGRGEPSEVMGLSRAEGCWTFDARDRMPRPSRATAHHLPEIAHDRDACSPPASGFVLRRTSPVGGRSGDGLLTEQIADARGRCRELVKMPHNRLLPGVRRADRSKRIAGLCRLVASYETPRAAIAPVRGAPDWLSAGQMSHR